jgi:hypothetical protein
MPLPSADELEQLQDIGRIVMTSFSRIDLNSQADSLPIPFTYSSFRKAMGCQGKLACSFGFDSLSAAY